MFCHSWEHYVIAKFKSLVRVDIQNVSPLGPAIELYNKFPSKKAQDHWLQIKLCQITLYVQFDWLDWSCQHLTFKILASSHHHESRRQSTGKSFLILVIWREIMKRMYRWMSRCSLAIGHTHYKTSWKSLIQQWVVWKESVANCKHCNATTSH